MVGGVHPGSSSEGTFFQSTDRGEEEHAATLDFFQKLPFVKAWCRVPRGSRRLTKLPEAVKVKANPRVIMHVIYS